MYLCIRVLVLKLFYIRDRKEKRVGNLKFEDVKEVLFVQERKNVRIMDIYKDLYFCY